MSQKKRQRKKKPLLIWHRYLGLAVALFVIILSITGILLNHTESLRLDERPVAQRWLLNIYGISAAEPGPAWKAGDHWVSAQASAVYLDDQLLDALHGMPLRGAIVFQGMTLIAAGDVLALYTPQAELVDTLSNDHFSANGIEKLAILRNSNPVMLSGKSYFTVDENFSQIVPLKSLADDTVFTEPQVLPEAISKAISQDYLGEGLPLERILLDLHSGRLFGKIGVYVMDSAAVLMIVLTITGLIIWIRRILRKSRRQERS